MAKRAEKRRRKLQRRIRDFTTMKMKFPGMYHQPGSLKK